MAKSIPVVLPSKNFDKKGDATAFFSSMLKKYKDREKVTDEDDKLLFELLQRHPENKISEGVEYFYRDKAEGYPTSCFHIKRVNGETTDFSIKDCINAKEQTLDQFFYKACRSSVNQILKNEKKNKFISGVVHCNLTGEVLSKNEAVYKHTTPKFREIVRSFKEKYDLSISRDMFVDNEDMQYVTEFSDKVINNNFIKFHQEIASLEMFKK
jgi:hypothetical protein